MRIWNNNLKLKRCIQKIEENMTQYDKSYKNIDHFK